MENNQNDKSVERIDDLRFYAVELLAYLGFDIKSYDKVKEDKIDFEFINKIEEFIKIKERKIELLKKLSFQMKIKIMFGKDVNTCTFKIKNEFGSIDIVDVTNIYKSDLGHVIIGYKIRDKNGDFKMEYKKFKSKMRS